MKAVNKVINKLITFFKNHLKSTIIVYKLFLDILFLLGISNVFEYAGFVLDFSIIRYLLSWVVFYYSIGYICRLFEKESFSNIIVFLMYLVYFVPSLTMYGLMNISFIYFICLSVYMFILLIANEKIKYIRIKTVARNYAKYIFNALIILVPIFLIYISYKYTGFRLIFDFINVYGIRLETKLYDMPSIYRYLLMFLNIVIPALLVYCLRNKKIFGSILMIVSQYLLFSYAAEKSIVVSLIVVLFSYFIYKKEYKYLIISALIVGALFIPFEARLFGSYNIMSYIFRRNLFLPAYISTQYYSYFTHHSLDFFTNGIMHWVKFSQIYPDSIGNILGNYYHYAATNLNNGLLGDAFSNLGYLGILVMPILLVITFRFMDALSYKTPRNIIFGFAVYYMMKFVNSFWSINLLSGGFIILGILLYFMQNRQDEDIVLNDTNYITGKVIKANLSKYYKKIIVIVLIMDVCLSGYFLLIQNGMSANNYYHDIAINTEEALKYYKNRPAEPKEEETEDNPYDKRLGIVKKDPWKEYSNYNEILDAKIVLDYYNSLKASALEIYQEIDDFIYYYQIKNIDSKERLDNAYREMQKYIVSFLVIANDDGEGVVNYYNDYTNRIIDKNEYFNVVENYYNVVNIISQELTNKQKVSVYYDIEQGVIVNYNIALVESNSSIWNKYGAFIVFMTLASTGTLLYCAISSDDQKKGK